MLLKFSQTSWDVRDKQSFCTYHRALSWWQSWKNSLETSTDEGLHGEDENAHPDPDSPKNQKQLILIRLIKSHLKFCSALLTPRFLVTWFDPRGFHGFGAKFGAEVAGNRIVCFLILEVAKSIPGWLHRFISQAGSAQKSRGERETLQAGWGRSHSLPEENAGNNTSDPLDTNPSCSLQVWEFLGKVWLWESWEKSGEQLKVWFCVIIQNSGILRSGCPSCTNSAIRINSCRNSQTSLTCLHRAAAVQELPPLGVNGDFYKNKITLELQCPSSNSAHINTLPVQGQCNQTEIFSCSTLPSAFSCFFPLEKDFLQGNTAVGWWL